MSPFILDEDIKCVELEQGGTFESFVTLFLRLMKEEGNERPV